MADTPKTTAKASPAGERIAKVLSRAGVASRREAERMIEAGLVTVNGKPITSPALNVLPSDRITVEGQPVAAPEAARLWLYYKPEGLVTSASDEKGRPTVFENLPEDMPRVMSIGRLDLNSEGLLLLTNDGELKRRLELPSTGWLRKYRVRVKGNPTDVDLEPLRKGITVDGERFQPMNVTMDRHQGANAWLTVGLREGRNREIRRAMTAINLTVNRLIRVSYGPFRLGEMEPNDVEEVRPKVLRDQLGMTDDSGEAPKTGRAATGAAPRRGPRVSVTTESSMVPPTAGRPGSGKPAAGKSTTGKPYAGKPSAGKPSMGKPSAGKTAPEKPAAKGTAPRRLQPRAPRGK
jgi:23S rRNA pseudouridine2605 synthase